jgi:hypothetical protein
MAFGSLTNHLMAGSKQVEPKVGMGATICCWSDRHAATIIKITECQIHVQEDIATRTDSNGMSESQTYDYSPNQDGAVIVFRKTKRGWKSKCGNGLLIGTRKHYYDYSF